LIFLQPAGIIAGDVGDNKKGVALTSQKNEDVSAAGQCSSFIPASIAILHPTRVIQDVLPVRPNRFGQRKD